MPVSTEPEPQTSDPGSSSSGDDEAPSPDLTPSEATSSERASRREFLGGAGVVVAVTGAVVGQRGWRWLSRVAFGQTPSHDQCEQLLARWLSHASRQRDPLVEERQIDQAEALARQKPQYVVDLARCENELTSDEVACGIEAPNADALERCVQ
jgi:hypothetical protein